MPKNISLKCLKALFLSICLAHTLFLSLHCMDAVSIHHKFKAFNHSCCVHSDAFFLVAAFDANTYCHGVKVNAQILSKLLEITALFSFS